MLSPVVFIGPSAPRDCSWNYDCRPPAAAGDLLALANGAPRVVALIDGVFDTSPSVQHKEILELLARGFVVLGASSMGALRAAELAPFGMTGIGAVYAAYASGRLTGDDEVALLHAPRELGYRPLTEALVDVRATLAAAAAARVIPVADARRLRAVAARIFWRERDWSAIVAVARREVASATLDSFAAWLPGGQRSVKRADATHCLAAALTTRLPTQPVAFRPPRTSFFAALATRREVLL